MPDPDGFGLVRHSCVQDKEGGRLSCVTCCYHTDPLIFPSMGQGRKDRAFRSKKTPSDRTANVADTPSYAWGFISRDRGVEGGAPEGRMACPSCGRDRNYFYGRRVCCARCNRHWSVTAGTVMSGMIPLPVSVRPTADFKLIPQTDP